MTKHIHFMGIGGSGASGVAAIASAAGYKVTGCDANADSPYTKYFEKYDIQTATGHSVEHLADVDTVVVSPALLFDSTGTPELAAAKSKNLVTWQEFLGKTLLDGKETLCVAGTHGKSTTTGMLAQVLENAKLDPTVMIGATVPGWKANFRIGKSKLALIEADEFYDNFLNYSPEAIILNNIEFDHPDFFKSENDYWKSFGQFISRLVGDKVLVFNQDAIGIQRLFEQMGEKALAKLTLFGYTLGTPVIELENSLAASQVQLTETNTHFKVKSDVLGVSSKVELAVPGLHNVSNALGVITLAKLYGVPIEKTVSSLAKFKGVGRRLELLNASASISVYSDYGHHPTEIKATLAGLRQKHPDKKVWCVVEPHSYSRTKALLPDYNGVFADADEVIITPIFPARDSSDFGMSGKDVVAVSGHQSARYFDSFDKVVAELVRQVKSGDVIVVMGAGKSNQLAHDILTKL